MIWNSDSFSYTNPIADFPNYDCDNENKGFIYFLATYAIKVDFPASVKPVKTNVFIFVLSLK